MSRKSSPKAFLHWSDCTAKTAEVQDCQNGSTLCLLVIVWKVILFVCASRLIGQENADNSGIKSAKLTPTWKVKIDCHKIHEQAPGFDLALFIGPQDFAWKTERRDFLLTCCIQKRIYNTKNVEHWFWIFKKLVHGKKCPQTNNLLHQNNHNTSSVFTVALTKLSLGWKTRTWWTTDWTVTRTCCRRNETTLPGWCPLFAVRHATTAALPEPVTWQSRNFVSDHFFCHPSFPFFCLLENIVRRVLNLVSGFICFVMNIIFFVQVSFK